MKTKLEVLDEAVQTLMSQHPGKTIGEVWPDNVRAVIQRQQREGLCSVGDSDAKLGHLYRLACAEVIINKVKEAERT